ncbi:hypothetical protein [Flavobacterium sp.]|uniref:hypothetical protein n=1 Tax=Flavobacterium sp. TaxID=239 RepID=UPI0026164666|nr:hypothetical protein [Flavobacterium sp.]MDG2432697.1 hypothetical protein [Flavobacterium sp.]
MKKKIFTLVALGMLTLASAANEKSETKEVEKAKKEASDKKKNEEKTVGCSIWDGNNWVRHEYSCFFCWGGATNGCIAEAVKELGLAQ